MQRGLNLWKQHTLAGSGLACCLACLVPPNHLVEHHLLGVSECFVAGSMRLMWLLRQGALLSGVVAALQVAYRIGRTMFETDSLPQHLVQHCNAMDEVWVPSEFNRETFISAGVVAAAQEHAWPCTPLPQGLSVHEARA